MTDAAIRQHRPLRVAIFGATSAIAAEIAAVYAARGAELFLVGRDQSKLTQLVGRVAPAVRGFRSADLASPEQATAAVAAALETLGGLDIAIIAHGLLGDQLASERDYDEAERIIRTNFLSPVALVIPLANYFESTRVPAQGSTSSAHIAVLSSVAGDRGRPRNYTYGSAKGALNVYLQGVRSRLWSRGVAVQALKLGPVDTPMTVDHSKNILFATADRAARDIVRAIARGRSEAYVPWYWRPIMAAVRPMPERLFQRIRFLSGR